MDKKDFSYKVEPAFEEATTLYNNGKVREVFIIASLGNIGTIETVEGDVYIVAKKDKFDEILNTLAEKQDVNINYIESEGINPQVGSEEATVQGE